MYKHRRNDSFQSNPSGAPYFDTPNAQPFQPSLPVSARPLPPPSSARSTQQPGKGRYGYLNAGTPRNYGAQTARDNVSSPGYSPTPQVTYHQKRREKLISEHLYHTPIHLHPRAQSTFDQNPYQSETTKEPSHHSKSARDHFARYPLPLAQYNTSSYKSQLSSSEMMTELQFSLSTIEISGYDKLEEISCSMHNLKDSVLQLKNLLNKPPKRPEQQHIEIPVSVWNEINQLALKTKHQTQHFETELQGLIKDAWDDKDKLLTKKREFEKVLMKVNEERKQNKRKILVQQTEIDQRKRDLESKETDLQQGYEQLENLWEEQTKRIKSNIGDFQDTMDYQFHDDWNIFLKSLKHNADTDSKQFIQQVHANHALTCSGKINFSQINGSVVEENESKNQKRHPYLERQDMLLVDELHIHPDGIKEDQIKALSGSQRDRQRRKLSFISDRVPCHSREVSNNAGQDRKERRNESEGERHYSSIDSDQDTAEVFNGPAKGMELDPVWDPELDDASSNRVESPARNQAIEQFKEQCESSEINSFMNQVLKIAKNKEEIVEAQKEKLEAQTERESRMHQKLEPQKPAKPRVPFLRERIRKAVDQENKVFIGSGSKAKKKEQSQSERISPMLASKLRHGIDQCSMSESGEFDHSVAAEVTGEQDPREWIKDAKSGDMMDLLKSATDECLVQRLEEVAINNGVEINRIVQEREKELEKQQKIGSDTGNLSLTHPALNQSVQISLNHQAHPKVETPVPQKSRVSSISSSIIQNPFQVQQAQQSQDTKVKYSSRQPSLEMSEQQIQSTRGLASKHGPQISITSSQVSDTKSRPSQVQLSYDAQEEMKSRNNLHSKAESYNSQLNEGASVYSEGNFEASKANVISEHDEGISEADSANVNSPGSPSIKVDLTEEPSEFIVKEKCLNPQMSLEVIHENQSEFSNSQSILDSVNRSEARKARVAKRKANEHLSLQENKSILARESEQLFNSQFAKSEIPQQFKQRVMRNLSSQIQKTNSSDSLDERDVPSLYQNESTSITNNAIYSERSKHYPPTIDDTNPQMIDITIETPAKREIPPQFESPAQGRARPQNSQLKSFVKNRQSAPASKRIQRPQQLFIKDAVHSKNYLDGQFSQKTPSARISFKRSSIKYKKINKQSLAESFSQIQKNSQNLFFPPNIKAKKQLEHDTSLSIQAHKILSNRKIASKLGSPSGIKIPYSGNSEESKAKKLMSRNLLESLSGRYSQHLGSGAALGSNLVGSGKQNSSIFKNMLYSLVGDPKGNSGAQMAMAKRPFEDNNALFNHNESRLFEALQLQYPNHPPYQEEKSSTSHCCLSEEIAPIYSSYVREGPIDLNLNRIGICFLSGEQNIQHFGEYSLVPEGFRLDRRESMHSSEESSKETLLLKKGSKRQPVQRQMGRIIRLNSGLFVTAAIDMHSLKSDISSTESRQFYFGAAPFKFQSGIISQRVSQKKSQHLEPGRAIETLKREGLNQKSGKQQGTIGEEIGSRITIKWN